MPPRGRESRLRPGRVVEGHQSIEDERRDIFVRGECGGIERGDARFHLNAQRAAVMRTRSGWKRVREQASDRK